MTFISKLSHVNDYHCNLVRLRPVWMTNHPPSVLWHCWLGHQKGYRGGSPTAVQAWQPCPLWEPSPSHPISV